jgi:hypothetical protein
MPGRAIIFRTYDPVAVELAEAHLRAAEIPFVRLGRGNAALLGAGDSLIEQIIEVDEEQAEQARELLSSIASDEVDDEQDDEEPAAPSKSLFIGGGLAILWPGLGLSYAGLPLTGLVIAAWAVVALATSFKDPLGLALFGGVIPRIVDFVATRYRLRRYGRKGPDVVSQALLALILVGAYFLGARYLSVHLYRLLAEDKADAQAG